MLPLKSHVHIIVLIYVLIRKSIPYNVSNGSTIVFIVTPMFHAYLHIILPFGM